MTSAPAAAKVSPISTASSPVTPRGADPVGGRDAHGDRTAGGERAPHGGEDLERVAQAVLEAAAVLVAAVVRERRDEAREQVAVGEMQLDHVEARPRGAFRRPAVGLGHPVHVGARHRARHLVGRRPRDRRGREERPAAFLERLVRALPLELRGALRPRVPELERELGRRAVVDVVDDPLPGRGLLVVPDPGAARRDPPVRLDVRHLRDHEPRAALGARSRSARGGSRRACPRPSCTSTSATRPRGSASSRSRRRNGVNIGGRPSAVARPVARRANQVSSSAR